MVDSEPVRDDDLLAGYVSGPAAATEATAQALARAGSARTVVFVEGVSDQIAVETLARRHNRDLIAERIAVLPVGGAHALRHHLPHFGPTGRNLRLAGLCDAGETSIIRQALSKAGLTPPNSPTANSAELGPPDSSTNPAGRRDTGAGSIARHARTIAGLGPPHSAADLAQLGFFVCVQDLEDELIRAAGPARVLETFAAHGDLAAFHTIQRQPAWRGKDETAQLRRFLAAGARRKLRYARLLTEAVDLDRVPRPLAGLLAVI